MPGKDFLYLLPKAQSIKEQIDKLNIEIKISDLQKIVKR
jgi:hypothetical protein